MEMINETTVEKKYPIIYVDAPWEGTNWSVKRVRDLPVGKRAAADALLLIWAPMEKLPDVLQVLGTWGFEYAGLLTWRKLNEYDDRYLSHGEYMLIGKKGTVNTSFLLRYTIHEPLFMDAEYKPKTFRSKLLLSGHISFGESAPHLDLFGGYWQRLFPEYDKEDWDFWED